ncbi:metalloregulator ArsR/SmtB family transcription factor [Kribbella lupini]|uniref:Metalloregulator ArsR/SmtB family transcription factor n=1 Tax=Kribbella lupini TaxID=291602 RepID=A0ABP4LES9_9ACTN
MEQIAAVLGDGARWRLVELLAERPRSVGELAELTGLRQPQTTKHLQTLAKAGLVTVFPLGQRRVYALETEPLQLLVRRLNELVDTTVAHSGERDVIARYRAAIEAETAIADSDRWADGRVFSFERLLPAPVDVVWQHWTDPALLASWWAPPSMKVVDCGIEPTVGGRSVLEYADAAGRRYRSEGTVHAVREPEQLGFTLSVLDAESAISFSSDYALTLAADPRGTRLRLDLRITETTVEAVPYIAGIGTGWGQVLDHLDAAVSSATTTKD